MIVKTSLYKIEQENIINNIINILDLDDENSITLYELDNNKHLQEQLLSLIPNIKKFFTISFNKGITNPDKTKRPYLSIIKQILKTKYNIYNSDFRINYSDLNIRTTKYIFIKK